MGRRFLLSLAALLLLAFAPDAPAQKEQPLPSPPPVADGAFPATPEAISAGRELYVAIIHDSGAMDAIFAGFEEQLVPPLRQTLLTSPLYQQSNPTQRQALTAFVESLPDFLREQMTLILEDARERAAARMATRMSPEHLVETAAFMRSPEMRPLWEALAAHAIARIDTDEPTPPFPEWRDLAFAQTEAGRAFAAQEGPIADILDEEFERSAETGWPRIEALLAVRMCAAMGDDCPADMREQAEGI